MQGIQLVTTIVELGKSKQTFTIVLLEGMIGVLVMGIVVVLGFQLWSVSVNLNTWEYLRWHRIEYLNIFEQGTPSPFNRGFVNNWRVFLKGILRKPVDWKVEVDEACWKNLKKGEGKG